MTKTDNESRNKIKYPKGEDVCATCVDKNGNPVFLITSKPSIGYFYIYEFTDSGLIKLGKGQSPLELEDKYNVRSRMGVE